MKGVLIVIVAFWVCLAAAAPVWADWKADIGYARLLDQSGDLLPDGAGIPVTQVEAPSSGHWLPNPADGQFTGKIIVNLSGDSGTSGHATSVGRIFYGNTQSLVPGVTNIDAYEANHWLFDGFLTPYAQYGCNWQPYGSTSRVANHSWVGSTSAAAAGEMLRRLDWVIDTDEFIQAVATGGTNKTLLGNSFNAIAVGRTDGKHTPGTAALDAVYTAGRSRPDIVAPMTSLSSAVPVVAGAATLLVSAGADPILSDDPLETYVINRRGDRIYNAQRAEVVKAALMAGADRFTCNLSTSANISDYRKVADNRNVNGTDRRFGAGQVNINNSFWILSAGEQNSAEDLQQDEVEVGLVEGFDYDPSFGGLAGSNRTASYTFTTGAEYLLLTAALVWHLDIHGGTTYVFNGTATFHDLDLRLFDMTAGGIEVAASESALDNSENLHLALKPNCQYMLQVTPGAGQADFDQDYALAWLLQKDADGDTVPDEKDAFPQMGGEWSDDDNDGLGDNFEGLIIAFDANDIYSDLEDVLPQDDFDGDMFSNLEEFLQGSDPTVAEAPRLEGDINGDCIVNMADFSILSSNWAETGENEADLNGDGIVNMADFSILSSNWGKVCP